VSETASQAQEQALPSALGSRFLQAYGTASREAQEQQWILAHLPLVRHVVQKIAAHLGPRADLDNLISAGTLGLVKAARAYDPTRDAEFKTYAYIRIRGMVLDELRGESFVPAAVHKQIRLAERAYQQYRARNGRPPDEEELAAELGISRAQLYRTWEEARRQRFLSIHGLSEERGDDGGLSPVDEEPRPDAQVERREQLERLAAAVRQLPARDRQMLLLYYERDLTMKEIAAVLDITESRVSQMHAAALFKLSMVMKGES
jgi:RNA polymerase sigma factor FliA